MKTLILKTVLLFLVSCGIAVSVFAQTPAPGTVTFQYQTGTQTNAPVNYVNFVPGASLGQDGGQGFEFITQGTGTNSTQYVQVSYFVFNSANNDGMISFDRNSTNVTITAAYIQSASSTAANSQSLTGVPAAGGEFRLTSIDLLSVSGTRTVTIQGYRNNAAVGTAVTISINATSKATLNLATNTDFYNVDRIAITGIGADGVRADNITTSTAITSTSGPSVPVDINSAANSVPENSPNGTLVGLTAYSTDPNNGYNSTNLALNKTVTVSSLENGNQFPGAAVVDGATTGGRWSSAFSDPQYITVDLGGTYDISRVRIYWENAYGKDYQIQLSSDGTNFSTIKYVSSNTSTTNDITGLSSQNSVGRYVRIYGTARATQYGYSMYELEVYGSIIRYSFASTANSAGGRFAVDAITGVVSVANSSLLDYETNTSHTVTVTATNGTTTSTANFTIAVTNVNEAPTITSAATASVPDNTYNVITLTATDPDAGSVFSYSLTGGADQGKFTVNASSGALRFTNAPQYYSPGSAAGSNTYYVNVTVTDNGSPALTNTKSMTVTVVQPATYGNYAYSMPLVLNTSNLGISSNQTNFPYLVSISDPSLVVTAGGCSNKVQFPTGSSFDFAFVDPSAGEIPYQVDNYNPATGTLQVWVKLPTLTYNANNTLTFYFGSNTANTSNNSNSVWPTDYQAVYHFNEGTYTGSTTDGTSNARTGTTTGMTTADLVSGKIGNAYSFNGSSKKITVASATVTGSFTISAWINLSAINADQKVMTNQGSAGGNSGGYKLGVFSSNIPESESGISFNRGSSPDPTAFTTGAWRYVQGVYNGTTLSTYVDGVQYKVANSTTNPTATSALYIGAGEGGNTYWFNGLIDEPRVSNIAKSTDWLKAEYVNQNNPANYTAAGSVTTSFTNASAIKGGITYSTNNGTAYTYTINGTTASANPPNDGTANFVLTGNATVPTTASIYAITVNSGVTTNLNGQVLNVGCNIFNNGTITSTTSTINFVGTAPQRYVGGSGSVGQTGDLTINNTNGNTVTVSGGNLSVFNSVNLTKGSLIIDNPGSGNSSGTGMLTLESTATKTASVAEITNLSYTITGNVIAERYVKGDNTLTRRQYRMLSSPVHTNPTGTFISNFDYLKSASYVTGPGGSANGFDKDTNPIIYLYREDFLTNNTGFNTGPYKGVTKITAGSNQFNVVLNTTVAGGSETVNLPAGNGFIFYFTGNRSTTLASKTALPLTAPEDVVYNNTGLLNQGPVTVSYWHSPSPAVLPFTSTTYGYFLAGNPYASSIDWSKFSSSNSAAAIYGPGLTNGTIWVLDPLKKTYDTYQQNGGTYTGNARNVIASGQGFLVRSTSSGKALTFNESAKTTVQPTTATDPGNQLLMSTPSKGLFAGSENLKTSAAAVSTKQVNTLQYVRLRLEQDTTYNDEVVIRMEDKATDTFDPEQDAEDLGGVGAPVSLSALSSDKVPLAIDWVPALDKKDKHILLNTTATTTGVYSLKANEIANIPDQYEIWLKDAYKKDSLNIGMYKEYRFNIDRSIADTYAAGRFEIVIRRKTYPPYQLINFKADKTTEGVNVTWKVYNEYTFYGFTLQKQDGSSQFIPVGQLQSDGRGNYAYLDRFPTEGINIYRLKQSDTEQNVAYSATASVLYYAGGQGKNADEVFSVFPTPATSYINVHLNQSVVQYNGKMQIRIYNGTGNMMLTQPMNGNDLRQDVSRLLPGSYIIEVLDQGSGTSLGRKVFVKL